MDDERGIGERVAAAKVLGPYIVTAALILGASIVITALIMKAERFTFSGWYYVFLAVVTGAYFLYQRRGG